MSKIFSLPFNGDLNFFNSIDWKDIYEVYGAPTETEVFHGRSRNGLLKSISIEELLKLAKICEVNGTYFNLVLNSPYYPPEFFKDNSHLDDLIKQFSCLPNIKYTITIPPVIDMLKKWNKAPSIKVSKFANIDSVDKLLRWKKFNIESFVLPADIVKKLDEIGKLCSQGIKPAILVNDPCIKGCPITNYHFTHSSMHSTDSNAAGYSSYCISYCKKIMEENPYEILRSSFVRPEDIDKYIELGVKYFKLVDRNKPSWWIQRAFNSYLNKSHEGNLLELFPLFYKETSEKSSSSLSIDNKKLDGLLKKQANSCNELICQITCFNCNEILNMV